MNDAAADAVANENDAGAWVLAVNVADLIEELVAPVMRRRLVVHESQIPQGVPDRGHAAVDLRQDGQPVDHEDVNLLALPPRRGRLLGSKPQTEKRQRAERDPLELTRHSRRPYHDATRALGHRVTTGEQNIFFV